MLNTIYNNVCIIQYRFAKLYSLIINLNKKKVISLSTVSCHRKIMNCWTRESGREDYNWWSMQWMFWEKKYQNRRFLFFLSWKKAKLLRVRARTFLALAGRTICESRSLSPDGYQVHFRECCAFTTLLYGARARSTVRRPRVRLICARA